MQTHKVLETIRWVEKQYTPSLDLIVSEEMLRIVHGSTERRDAEFRNKVLYALQASGAVLDAIDGNPDAKTVMDVFGLQKLRDRHYLAELLGAFLLLGEPGSRRSDPSEHYQRLVLPWNLMVGCVRPFTLLTIPNELQASDSEGLLSLEVSERPELKIEAVQDVLKAVTGLYGAIAKAYSNQDNAPLTLIKIESGSGFTVSLKGVADIVKETKNFVVEIWNKHRHKRADEIINHNRAVASSIEVLEHIETRVKKKSLDPEDGERLKRAVVNNTLSLFKNGALLTDIPHIEMVDNRQLLDGFNSPRLLAAPDEIELTGVSGPSSAPQTDKPKRPARRKAKVPPTTS